MENYQKRLDDTLNSLNGKPTLLLHACCAPCSSYVLEYLSNYFDITLLFYNPNISPEAEYEFRCKELIRLVNEMLPQSGIKTVVCDYDSSPFYELAKGLENEPECGKRCKKCYFLRLEAAAEYAKKHEFDYFCTTLSISPHKNAEWLNEIGKELSNKYDVKYLYSDFKKKNGYKRSIELSREYELYRQDYCGCVYSKAEAQKRNCK
ncbi:MAG: epoxyqueuosine reductase QueH [Clostridia bacterium]|nr:epoxyqueuosine reductase QueH [Clostridia bacterium]MEE1024543.1 epoxyqueuosine reductase QueH [Acutalibacteraceae bacterium]